MPSGEKCNNKKAKNAIFVSHLQHNKWPIDKIPFFFIIILIIFFDQKFLSSQEIAFFHWEWRELLQEKRRNEFQKNFSWKLIRVFVTDNSNLKTFYLLKM